MKNLINQAKKELRKINKGVGVHEGVLKKYIQVNFPSIENGLLDNFIKKIILTKFKNVK
jgi:hypothetical protein